MIKKALSVGVDDFGKLICGNYYYVDKTLLIKELLDRKGEVNLFTRPRRFGKTLNMSMLKYYFEDTGNDETNKSNRDLFSGMNIMNSEDRYLDHMNHYPVISLSLKSGKRAQFSSALFQLCEELGREFDRHRGVMDQLPTEKQQRYQRFLNRSASADEYSNALRFLSEVLWSAYGRKVIILIDEYDVPLENAWFCGFYDQMIDFLRSMFEGALKTNPCLEFAVMTGCLRVSKESIFTGLNNLKIISILNPFYGEYFGFSPDEVNRMMEYYGITDHLEQVREWYDGYLFGNTEVYNPWSITNYVEGLAADAPSRMPVPFWANTSSNSIVKSLIEHADISVKGELEELLSGGSIEKPIHEDITYDSIYESDDNLWNFLFFTGYLKKTAIRMDGDIRYISLAIPNREVRYIYNSMIMKWFRESVRTKDLSELYRGLLDGDTDTVQREISALLMQSISYMDGREEFYHGFMLGILENMRDYLITSNREGGLGRYDIAIRHLDVNTAPVILELKVSRNYKDMETDCDKALAQIRDQHYNDWLPDEGYTCVWDYGIAFYKKQCRVKAVRVELA